VCALLSLPLLGTVAQADIALPAITAVQSRTVADNNPSGTTSSSSLLRIRPSSACYKAWLQFDLSTIANYSTQVKGHITGATLTFTGTSNNTSAKPFALAGLNDGVNDAWASSSLTWNNAPANDTAGQGLITAQITWIADTTHTLSVPAGAGSTVSDSSAALLGFLNADQDGKVTFILAPGGTTYLLGAGSSAAPSLTLTYSVPEPATLAVLGLGGLLLRRRLA